MQSGHRWAAIAAVGALAFAAVLADRRLTPAERLMRVAVVALMLAVTVTQAAPRA